MDYMGRGCWDAVAIFELGRMKRNRPTSPEINVLAADIPGKLHRKSSDGSFNDLQRARRSKTLRGQRENGKEAVEWATPKWKQS